MKLALLLFPALLVAQIDITPADYRIKISGPTHVTQGRSIFVLVTGVLLSGTDLEQVTPSISGLPDGSTGSFVNLKKYCCGTNLYRISSVNPIQITTMPTTEPGVYPVTVKYRTRSGNTQSTVFDLTVYPIQQIITSANFALTNPPPLQTLEKWNSNMLIYGKTYCNTSQLTLWEGNVWYYDGIRTYMQMFDRTKDPFWLGCAELQVSLYQPYVASVKGLIPGWRVFPHGLGMHYSNGGSAESKAAVIQLESANAVRYSNIASAISWSMSREISYALNTLLVSERLGSARRPEFTDYVDLLFGHFDQWFVSKNAKYVQPFMVALAAEALIDYWNVSKDPRVLPMLKTAADQLWANSWNPTAKAFEYYNENGSHRPAPDLNLLIAPLYGWVYRNTGDVGYRDQGDQIFDSGVNKGWLGGGKQFSQAYRWSGKYVEWRVR